MQSRPGEASQDARTRLRALLESDGVLDGEITPLRSRSGQALSWLLYTPQITLTGEGNRLAARCLIDRLEPFGRVQLASYGLTGLPLMIGVTVESDGRYNGLIVRERPKLHGALRQIDGPVQDYLPVVIVDDSLVSGEAFRAGVHALEAAGLRVAGIVCLVEFGGRGGRRWAESLGYRVEAVFELERDLELGAPPPFPTFAQPPLTRLVSDTVSVCETLPDLAHFVAGRLLDGQPLDTVPTVTRDCDAAGGVFVSLRHVATDTRMARDGFFFLDGEAQEAATAVALATERCVRRAGSQLTQARLMDLKLAVTCISALEATTLAELDARRYGLIVRNPARPWQIGTALPDTPEREGEPQQYREALRKAGLRAETPHELLRFTVTKHVQAGQPWQPYGVGAPAPAVSSAFVDHLRGRVEQIIDGAGAPAADAQAPAPPWDVHGVGVSVYRDGALQAIHVSLGSSLHTSLERATTAAWAAARDSAQVPDRDECELVVSLLHHRHRLGTRTAAAAAGWFRPSEHTVVAETAGASSVVLPHLACHHGWDGARVTGLALGKTGRPGGDETAAWTSYQTDSWLIAPGRTPHLRTGFAQREDAALDTRELAATIADHILAEAKANDGLPTYGRQPVVGTQYRSGAAGRVILALTGLAEAAPALNREDYRAAARRGALRVLDGLRDEDETGRESELPGLSGPAAQACALMLLSGEPTLAREPRSAELFGRVSALFRADGMITALPDGLRLATDHDVLPGVALTAVAHYASAVDGTALPATLDRQLHWYRRRFAKAPSWLAAGWLMQGWSAAWRLTRDPRHAAFVFALADWTMARQFRVTGAFLTDPGRRTGCFNTGYLAEGIGAALALSADLGDRRQTELRSSLSRAIRFMSTLVIRREDLYCMRQEELLIGAVRDSSVNPALRIDQSAHALRAVLAAVACGVREV